ncbi:MAG: hypothetical protein QXP59_01970 [Saccharolobus sp.]
MNYKAQGSTEYILMIAAIIIVAIVGIVFLFTNVSKPTHTQFNGQLLNITEYWSNSTVFNIGTITTSQYFLFSTTSPLPPITNDTNNRIYLMLAQGGAGNGVNDSKSYTPQGITLVSSQNGEYTYAVNDSPYYPGYSPAIINSPNFPAPEGLDYIELNYYNQNITILPATSPITIPVIQLTTSPALSLLSLSNSYVSPYGNITYTETGLPAGATWISKESQTNFYINSSIYTTTNDIVKANSINEVSLNPLRDNFIYYSYFPYTIESNSVNYNGIIYSSFPNPITQIYPQQTTYNFNYYQLKFGSFGYKLNKPLNSTIRGAVITLNNIPLDVIYSQSPFSNMLLTANAPYPNGNPIYALVTNYTSSSVTMDVWYDGSNTNIIYANFLNPSQTNIYNSYTGVVLPTNTTNWEQIGDTIFGGTSNFIALPKFSFNGNYNEPNIFSSAQANTIYLAGMLGVSTAGEFNIGFNDSILIKYSLLNSPYQTPYGGYYFSSSFYGYYNYILYVNNTNFPNYITSELVNTNYINFQIAMSYSNNPNSTYLLINNEPLIQSTTTDSVNSLSFAVDDASGGAIVYAAQTTSNIYNYIATKIT